MSPQNERLDNFLQGCQIFADRLKGVDEAMLREGVTKSHSFYDSGGAPSI